MEKFKRFIKKSNIFNKININEVISEHHQTLYYRIREKSDDEFKKIPCKKDYFLFYGLPIFALAAILLLYKWYPIQLSELVLTIISASSAAFFALMLTVLFSIIDRSEKLKEKLRENHETNIEGSRLLNYKISIFSELYYNISYSMIAALFLVIFSIITASLIQEKGIPINPYLSFSYTFFSGLVISLSLNLVFTLLMIIRRVCYIFKPEPE